MKKYFEAGIEQEEKMSNLDVENLELFLENGLQMIVADCMGIVGLKAQYEVDDGIVYIQRFRGYLDATQSDQIKDLAETLGLDYTDVLETLQDLMEEGANKMLEEGAGKHFTIEFGEWKNGGFSWDIFVEHAETEEEAIRIGTERYTKGAGKAVYVWSPNGELVLERRDDIDIDQSYIDGFNDALKSLAPSFDAEEDMHMSGKPWAEDSLIGTPYSDLATEAIAYEAGKKAAEAVAEDIERMCAEEKAMKEEEEDYPF